MSTPPAEPEPERTISEIVYGKVEGIDATEDEQERLKDFLRTNPTLRLSNLIRVWFPDLAAEVAAEADNYDTSGDPNYTVRGEAVGETQQAEGLNRGDAWVARFVGDYIGQALREVDARELANEHYRLRMQEGQLQG